MINNTKFNEIFQTKGHTRRVEKERRIAHYQGQSDLAIEGALIESYKSTGQHPCAIDVGSLISDMEDDLLLTVSETVANKFSKWLEQEILDKGDFD